MQPSAWSRLTAKAPRNRPSSWFRLEAEHRAVLAPSCSPRSSWVALASLAKFGERQSSTARIAPRRGSPNANRALGFPFLMASSTIAPRGGAPNMYSEKPPYSENHFWPAAGDENFGIPLPSFPYLPMSIFCASVLISDILFWPYSMSLTTLYAISTRTLVCTCWLSHSGFTTAKAKTLAK